MVAPGSWGARAGPARAGTSAEHRFALTPAQVAFRDEVRALSSPPSPPAPAARTSARCSPRTPSPPWLWPGSWACRISPAWGGRGLGAPEAVVAVEGVPGLRRHGGHPLRAQLPRLRPPGALRDAEQRQRWLPDLVAGQVLAGLRPHRAGSRLGRRRDLRAVRKGLLGPGRGSATSPTPKRPACSSSSPSATRRGARARSRLPRPAGHPSLSVGPRHKLGVQYPLPATSPSPPAASRRTPSSARPARLPIAFGSLERGRVGIAAQALGIAQACLDARPRPGQSQAAVRAPTGRSQAVQFALADMALDAGGRPPADLPRARPSGRRAPRRGRGPPWPSSSPPKRQPRATKAVQLHRALGYMQEDRWSATRDAKVTEICGRTSEIQRLLIARHLLS